MLSRAATSLAMLGRHLERADNLARILGVHVALSLDRTDEPGPTFWVRFMELAGWQASTVSRNADVPRREIGRHDRLAEVRTIGGVGGAEAKHKRNGCTELNMHRLLKR